jgi:hypothetical protein
MINYHTPIQSPAIIGNGKFIDACMEDGKGSLLSQWNI